MILTTNSPLAGDAAAARAFAYMIAQCQPMCPDTPLPSNHLLNSVTSHFRWTIAAISEHGSPSRFGQYAACSPVRRCVGCANTCTSELLVSDIQRHAQSDVLLLAAGGGFDTPSWVRVHIAIGGSPALSGVAVPFVDANGAVNLAMVESGYALLPDRNGLALKKLWQPTVLLEAQAGDFRHRLRTLRNAVIALNDYHFGGEFS